MCVWQTQHTPHQAKHFIFLAIRVLGGYAMNHYDDQGPILHFFTLFSIRTLISLVLLLILGSFLALIGTKQVSFFKVPTSSMEPTFIPGDKLISIHKSSYARGDVIVLDDPNEEGAYLLKRLVALEGDTISISTEGVRINNVLIQEPYIKEPIIYRYSPYTLPKGKVFVLGDNRNESSDSHLWGSVPVNTIIGQVQYIYAPKDRSTALKNNNTAFNAVGQ